MKQFIYTEKYDIINVDSIKYIFINSLSPYRHVITASLNKDDDGVCIIPIQNYSSEEDARKAMDEIMVALANGRSYSVRPVCENND